MARHIATLPMRLGGLGLRAATRTAPGAFWASWADALHMIDKRLPALSRTVVRELSEVAPLGCLGALVNASDVLDRSGFVARPTWEELRAGARPPLPPERAEPGEWQHGWQYHASASSELHFRETLVLAQSCPADQAHLRSHSGPASCAVLHGAPTGPEFKLAPDLFRTLVLERMRLPLQVSEAHCECGSPLDVQGRHRAVCPRSGRLKSRAQAPERTLARVCREAGATVRFNAMLRDMNIAVAATDHRAIEVLASGLPLHHGVQLAVDITIRCAHTAESRACPNAATTNGAVLQAARAQKATKYAELLHGDRCRLVVVGVETGGRWSDEAMQFIAELAACKAREAPPVMRFSTFLAWQRRWTRMIATSCGRAVAHSLVSSKGSTPGSDGPTPDLADLFGEV